MQYKYPLRLLGAVFLAAALSSSAFAVTSAEVTRPNSSGPYVVKKTVNGVTTTVNANIPDYFKAVNTAIGSLDPNRTAKEWVYIRAGGSSGTSPEGTIKWINVFGKPTGLDFFNNTVNCTGTHTTIRGIHFDRAPNCELKNVIVTGSFGMGVYIQSCNGMKISGVRTIGRGVNGIGVRVDNYTSGRNRPDLYMTGFVSQGLYTSTGLAGNTGNNHGMETANIEGRIDDVTSNNVGSCSLLLNRSRNITVSDVVGDHCDTGGSYASFRAANQGGAGGPMTVSTVVSRDCGRGLFTTTDSSNLHVGWVSLQRSGQGILLQTGRDSSIGSAARQSEIIDCPESIRIDDAHLSSNLTNIILRAPNVRGTRRGIYETDGAGSNVYTNIDARVNASGNSLNVALGSRSTFSGQR